jgi:histone H1/5
MPLRYVESKYKLEIGAAQTTQLAKAISAGADKGVFVLPKGIFWWSIF